MFAVNDGRAMNFLDASTMSALGSDPPVAVPLDVPVTPPPQPDSPGILQAITAKTRIRNAIYDLLIYVPSRPLSADSFLILRTLPVRSDIANGDLRLSARTAGIPSGRCPRHVRSAPQTGSPAAGARHRA